MVHFMLNTDSIEAFGPFGDALALIIQICDLNPLGAVNLFKDIGNGEAAFLIGECVFNRLENFSSMSARVSSVTLSTGLETCLRIGLGTVSMGRIAIRSR